MKKSSKTISIGIFFEIVDLRKLAGPGPGAGACDGGGGFDLLRGYTGSVNFVFRHVTLAVVAAF